MSKQPPSNNAEGVLMCDPQLLVPDPQPEFPATSAPTLPYSVPEEKIKIIVFGPNNTGRSSLARFIQEAIYVKAGVTAYIKDDSPDGHRSLSRIPKHVPIDIEVLTSRKGPVDLSALLEKLQALSTSLAVLGEQKLTAEQSRDRVLAANCDMTQKLRDLAAIARAAERYRQAVDAFFAMSVPDDATTEKLADADCELENLLEQHVDLFRR